MPVKILFLSAYEFYLFVKIECKDVNCDKDCTYIDLVGQCPYCRCEVCPQLNCEHHCEEVVPEVGCPFCKCAECPKLYCSDLCKTIIPKKGCAYCECHGTKCDDVVCASGCIVESLSGECPKCNCADNAYTCSKTPGKGTGKDYLIRYYHEDGMCKTFIYSGEGGNSNKFMSREECESFCGVKSCPTLVCHHGCYPEDSYKDCPKKCICEDKYKICQMPVMEGFGDSTDKRYYYDPKYGVCDHFYFKGKGGNYNNFKTQKDCADFCDGFPVMSYFFIESADVCNLYKDSGPCEKWEKRFYYDFEAGECKKFSFGGCNGNGNNFQTVEDCENTCKSDEDPCTLEKDSGPCFGHHKKYYYDSETDRCSIFYFGGCYGNKNKFNSQEECEHRCKKQMSICDLQMDKGSCNGQHKRYFYDSKNGICMEFYFGGCDGNLNNFKNKYECEAECMAETDLCKLEKDSGSCYGNLDRYYYNENAGECLSFIYGGCDGNFNNFVTKDECEAACKEQTNVCQMKPDKGPCHENLRLLVIKNVEHTLMSATCLQNEDHAMATSKNITIINLQGNVNRLPMVDAREMEIILKTWNNVKRDVRNLLKNHHLTFVVSSPDKGPCEGHLKMYFFNPATSSCEVFYYGGCEGNRNNFQTVEECEAECKVSTDLCDMQPDKGTCYVHTTRYYFHKETGSCETFVYGGCGGNENNFESVKDCKARCLETNADVCQLNPEKGPCHKKMQRYYFNRQTGNCEIFYYGGCQGNANNFKTMEQCQHQCNLVQNDGHVDKCQLKPDQGPCYRHVEMYYYNSASGNCEVFTYGGCKGNGNNFKTIAECQSECGSNTNDRCDLLPEKGPCYGREIRYYFNAGMGQCLTFTFGGCKGNLNNFKTLEECQGFCQGDSDICSMKPKKGNCYSKSTRFYFNPGTGSCQKMHGCEGIGNNFPTKEECMNTCAQSTDVCDMHVDKGPCYKSLERYFYNSGTKSCEKFIYGGCQGNSNNFKSIEACKSTCLAPTNFCDLKPDKGPCYGFIERYYYDGTAEVCKKFTYGGCDGNENNFKSIYDCEHECKPAEPEDICSLPKDKGPCYKHIARYYFDSLSGQCLKFTYGGCEGNENNFKTIYDCQNECKPQHAEPEDICSLPKEKGPCYGHVTRYYFDSHSSQCKKFAYGGCEGNENNFETIYDCQNECRPAEPEDICSLPNDKGPCYRRIARYYFDSHSGQCQMFTYGGCEGNKNNFKTISDCQNECKPQHYEPEDICSLPKEKGPCYGHVTRYYFDSHSSHCKKFTYGGCEGNENNFKTIYDCQNECKPQPAEPEDICSLPKDKGPCYNSVSRYYFNSDSGQCQKFTYGGCEGNENNFKTISDCQNECKPQHYEPEDICSLPKEKGPCYGHVTRYYYDSHSSHCKKFNYGGCEGNENNFKTIYDCQNECKPQPAEPEDICSLPKDKGPCYNSVSRYYFNSDSGQCQKFTYGGCEGNENNFKTISDCQNECKPQHYEPEDICSLPKEKGPCYGHVTRYYYDSHSSHCKKFNYGGCEGNENNFKTIYDCQNECKPQPAEPEDICSLPKDKGPCYNSVSRYYFNSDSGQCQKFTYGGCEGNENNFKTISDCQNECKPQHYEPEDICSLPKEKGPCYGHVTRYYFDSHSSHCKKFTYGGCEGNENNFKTISDCQNECKPQPAEPEDICSLPKDKGPCYNSVSRYYFNSDSGQCQKFTYGGCEGYYYDSHSSQCKKFTYGGCEGNENNFNTIYDCQNECKPAEPEHYEPEDICSLPNDEGPCYKHIARYYFDSHSGQCQMFTYGGCEGNKNNFKTISDCQNECKPQHHEPEDICSLPKEKGPCYGHVTRYYFDSHSSHCKKFTYGGCEGNENNFKTIYDCQNECKPQSAEPEDICSLPKDKGPCYNSVSRYYFNSDSGQCQKFTYGGCEGNENNFKTIYDCQNECKPQPAEPEDICSLPKDKGPCYNSVSRYYFNSDSGQCQKFTYGGCEGNENNFKTIYDCQNECKPQHAEPEDICSLPKEKGPCYGHVTRYYFDSHSSQCKKFTYGGCEGNENNFNTIYDCQNECKPAEPEHYEPEDICSLPNDEGPCYKHIARYYFDSHSGQCQMFTYGGCEGNKNNFKTISDCQNECKPQHHEPEDICSLPKEKGPCYGHVTRYYFDSHSSHCKKFTYGGCEGNENNFKTIYDCQNECKPQSAEPEDICSLPKDKGPCYNSVSRYYFNSDSGQCQKFTYGGCEGNENNFKTIYDCQNECKPQSAEPEDICSLPKDKGPCYNSVSRYYFNSDSGQCQKFTYGGCEGNENNFKTIYDCQNECKPQPAEPEDICSLPKDKGPCYNSVSRYYFNSDSRQCQKFTYGGCEGNKNNFETIYDCQNECRPEPENICDLPPKRGPCYGKAEKYYYDGHTCKTFIYSGCDGNGNNFKTLSECQQQCNPQQDYPQDVCALGADKGSCYQKLKKYYFNSDKGMCQVFYYGGCGGNDNRFSSEEECQDKCMANEEECPPLYCDDGCWETTTDHSHCPTCACESDCMQDKDVGKCDVKHGKQAKHERYYYNRKSGKCEQFYYGGCEGNGNHFFMKSECEKRCHVASDSKSVCTLANACLTIGTLSTGYGDLDHKVGV
ncbi:Papilin [Nymphon striatum]|nr:Papilin [Nymphon striatum]